MHSSIIGTHEIATTEYWQMRRLLLAVSATAIAASGKIPGAFRLEVLNSTS